MVEETPRRINEALKAYDAGRLGIGAAIGQAIAEGDYPHKAHSLLAAAHVCHLPVTVHVAIGADTIHAHPSTDAALLGAATYADFQRLTLLLRGLHDGGCYWNVGSAVLLPEVFLKALTLCRNTGHAVERFITVNLDMLQHYRPDANVVRRPTRDRRPRLYPHRASRDHAAAALRHAAAGHAGAVSDVRIRQSEAFRVKVRSVCRQSVQPPNPPCQGGFRPTPLTRGARGVMFPTTDA